MEPRESITSTNASITQSTEEKIYNEPDSPTPSTILKSHYIEEFNLTIGYPDTWEAVSDYEYNGNDGSLIISELMQYRSRDFPFVCDDFAFHLVETEEQSYENININYLSFGEHTGCAIEIPTLQKNVGIVPIAWGEKGIRYLCIQYETQESPEVSFQIIADAFRWDDEFQAPVSVPSVPPDPVVLSLPNGITITEIYLYKAVPRGYSWEDYGTMTPHIIYSRNCDVTGTVGVPDYPAKHRVRIFQQRTEYKYCTWDDHWILEDKGYIIMDGEILNHHFGYEDMFDWGILSGKPFFFYSKDGLTHLSLDGETLPVAYDYIHHYGCCEGPRSANPGFSDTRVWFNGVRDDNWYIVEVTIENE